MQKICGLVLFVIGIVFLHIFSTVSFLLSLLGVNMLSSVSMQSTTTWGFVLPAGAVIMVIGGLIYGLKVKEVTK